MSFIYGYLSNFLENAKFGKWQLLLLPFLFCVVGAYIEISTLNGATIPFKSLAVKNILVPIAFFIIGFALPIYIWRRYAIRFPYGVHVLWNKDGFSFAFMLLVFAVLLQIFAVWGNSAFNKVYVTELGGFYTEGQLSALGGFKNEIVMLKRQVTIFGITFQVGEIVKVFFMIFIAKLLTDMKSKNQIRWCKQFFIQPLLAFLPIFVMTASMPNYSMAMIFTLLLFFMIFVQEMDLKLRIPLILVLLFPIIIAFSISKLEADNPLVQTHGVNRIWAFFNEDGAGNEQQNEALQAMADGGIIGKGLDKGTIKLRLFGARNDFAFAILGEELGLWLMLPVTIAMIGFLFACFWVAASIKTGGPIPKNREEMTALLAQNIAWGIAIIFSLNIFLHIGVNLKFLPNTGQPLSFVSSGGANLAMNFFLMGMLVQISSLNKEDNK
ncbi:MAG: FtsW/RodA/SpoVE family cell cycle protein [Fibromonadaceae bacterium]|jgi:rod shape determining protein RodA|nr:FtsW/RodA/SpoVE family cell cycle protein [Fibromonadaceae bacterium]